MSESKAASAAATPVSVASPIKPDNLVRAASFMVLATFAFTGMSACIQLASRSLPNAEVVFVRNLIGLLFIVPWLLFRGGWVAFKTQRPLDHLLRSAAGLSSMYCYFYAIAHLPLADAVVLNYTVPLFFPVIESIWLREPMQRNLWWPLLLGFVGIVVVLRPGSDVFKPAALVGVTAGILSALAQTGVRRLTLTEPPERIVFFFAFISSLASAVPLTAVWVTPTSAMLGLFLLLGACATVGQLSMTRAYSHAPASQVGAFAYTIVLFGALFDWIRTGKIPSLLFIVGAILICGSGVLMLRLARPAVKRVTDANR